MQDKIETYGKGTVIQHGKLSDRVYLMKMHGEDFPDIVTYISKLAKDNNYTKIFCKVPCWASPTFISNGFIIEAHIPKFYNNRDDVFFMSKFLNSDRIMNFEHDKLEKLSGFLYKTSKTKPLPKLKSSFKICRLYEERAEEISNLYKQVFASYPFPIFDPSYISRTMNDNIIYYGVEKKGSLVALASAETDMAGGNVEMTDFATLPAYRGNNLAVLLLHEMELEMNKLGITTLYTIARLNSAAMNITFLKLNYSYAGTLIKNTNIAGKIESMNVLYKNIGDERYKPGK